jgi:hypothetical protein
MSQIVVIRVHKTKMNAKNLLLQAIADAGYTLKEGFFDRFRSKDEIRLQEADIKFQKKGEFYEMVARGNINGPAILQNISQRYIYHLTRNKLEEQGFALSSEETQKDGRIHLVLRRMA